MNRQRSEANASHPIDHWVGHILRRARMANVVSLEQIATPLGYSAAEWEACEYGMLRVDAVSLYRAAALLGVTFDALFCDVLPAAPAKPPTQWN